MYVSNLLFVCLFVFVLFFFVFIRLTVLPFLFEQICQLVGQLRVTLNGFNRWTNIFVSCKETHRITTQLN